MWFPQIGYREVISVLASRDHARTMQGVGDFELELNGHSVVTGASRSADRTALRCSDPELVAPNGD